MKKPLILVQIVNYNGAALLGEKLDRVMKSVIRQKYPNYIINFIDNGSKDSSREKISALYPGVRITKINKNIGYTAHNAGLRYFRYIDAKYLLIMNNDLILSGNTLLAMSDFMESNPKVGACMPVIHFASKPDYINSTGIKLNRAAFASNRDYGKSENSEDLFKERLSALSGACMMLRRDVVDSIGLFDYSYGSYYEDSDFSIRLLTETDYELAVVKNTKVYHYESSSFSKYAYKKDFLVLRNQYLLILRHFTLSMQLRAFLFFLRTRFLKRIILHSKIFLSLLLAWPSTAGFRIASLIRKKRSAELLLDSECSPYAAERGIFEYASFADDRELEEKCTEEEVIFGVNDSFLGKGFSPLTETFPQGRAVNGKAALFLKNRGRKFLRIVWYGPGPLHAELQGRKYSADSSPMIVKNDFSAGAVKLEIETSARNLITRAGFADEG